MPQLGYRCMHLKARRQWGWPPRRAGYRTFRTVAENVVPECDNRPVQLSLRREHLLRKRASLLLVGGLFASSAILPGGPALANHGGNLTIQVSQRLQGVPG